MRTLAATLVLLASSLIGCDSAMTDASPKPEVTGTGPREPDGPGKPAMSGNVDLGEVRGGGPLETRAQDGPAGAPKPIPDAERKAR